MFFFLFLQFIGQLHQLKNLVNFSWVVLNYNAREDRTIEEISIFLLPFDSLLNIRL